MRVKQLTNEINIQKWSKIIEECRKIKLHFLENYS